MCTPGRMIDMLGANSGEFITLGRAASLSLKDIMQICTFDAFSCCFAWIKCDSMIQYIMNQISTTY